MEDNNSKIVKIVKEAKDLMSIFEELKNKSEINSNSSLLKYLDKNFISKYILQYLEIKDLINLRTSCRDLNTAVSSIISIVSFYKCVSNKKSNTQVQNLTKMLRQFGDMNDTDDIEMEMESLRNVKFKDKYFRLGIF